MAIEFISPVVSVGSLAWAVYTVKSTARRERRAFVRNETIKSVSAALELLIRAEGFVYNGRRDGVHSSPTGISLSRCVLS